MKKTLLATMLLTATGIAVYEARKASHLQEHIQALRVQQDLLAEQNLQLQKERDRAITALAAAEQGTDRSRDNLSELLRLRAEVARLRENSRTAPAKAIDPTESEMKSWLGRVNELKVKLQQLPEQKIPEFQFLTDQDWLAAVRNIPQLKTEAEVGKALSALRTAAKNEFAPVLQNALHSYAQAQNGQLPTDWSQLRPYFTSPVDDSILQRYEFAQPGMVVEKVTPLGNEDDNYFQISMNTIGSSSIAENTLQPVLQAFSAANNGQTPADPAQLLPYVRTAAEQSALQRLMQNTGPR
jgi:hypothetical protein